MTNHAMGKVCFTVHISGESKCAPYAFLGQNSSCLPHLGSLAYTLI